MNLSIYNNIPKKNKIFHPNSKNLPVEFHATTAPDSLALPC